MKDGRSFYTEELTKAPGLNGRTSWAGAATAVAVLAGRRYE